MPIEGYIDYKRREFCKDIKCPVQIQLDSTEEGRKYDEIRNKCKTACVRTTYEFHHWLINKGYEIVRLKETINNNS